MSTGRCRLAAVLVGGLLVAGCDSLASPPPDLTEPAAAGGPADVADSAAADPSDPAAATADAGSEPRDASETGDASDGSDDTHEVDPVEELRHQGIHPDRYLTRWVDHHLPRVGSWDDWAVTSPPTYHFDLAARAIPVEPDGEWARELERARAEMRALTGAEQLLEVGYLTIEFDGGYEGLIWHHASPVDGEAVRVLDLAATVAGFIQTTYRVHIVGVEQVDGVPVFNLAQGPGGIEARIWRHGPRTVMLSGPIGMAFDDIVEATIAANPIP